MIRINYTQQAVNLFIYLIIQIPLLYKTVLFDKAFGFFYIGFILLLPYGLSRTQTMVISFFSGLIIDVFSNTPGIHASACVFIAFAKDYWYQIVTGNADDDVYLNWNDLGIWGSLRYLLPLTFFHHSIIFTIENGGFSAFGFLFSKILLSSIYSFMVVFALVFLTAPRARRI